MTGKRIRVTGIVQGVGFRPFVYREAHRLSLFGTVQNTSHGVEILVSGGRINELIDTLKRRPPPLSRVHSIQVETADVAAADFDILESDSSGARNLALPIDTAVCNACLAEFFDPEDRRYLYPFINCTECGPRYTLISDLPYDRQNTAMASFKMCADCEGEYRNPKSRRFHAETNCCAQCGPAYAGIEQAATDLMAGKIVAIKGVGGYHLACRADDMAVIRRLRDLKERDEKPFAVMIRSLEVMPGLNEQEKALLSSPEAPIVLTRYDSPSALAPGLDTLGLFLPYAPIHHLLFHLTGLQSMVMTSGNRKNEPMAVADGKKIFAGIADFVLDHNRDILVRNDDSVVRQMAGIPVFLRRSRGYAPGSVAVDFNATGIVGLGAMLKNSLSLGKQDRVFLSQYIGDLENEAAYQSLSSSYHHLTQLLDIKPTLLVADKHPDYLSTRFGESLNLPMMQVQHHAAHAFSCLAENRLTEAVAAVFDGAGYGDDGHIWGGEIFILRDGNYSREDHLSYMPMPGGDACVTHPLRLAAAVLHDRHVHFPGQEKTIQLLEKKLSLFHTSGMGRLFDAAAALLGICTHQSYEGQAPMMLEACAQASSDEGVYDVTGLNSGDILEALYQDNASVETRAARFHHTVAAQTVLAVQRVATRNRLSKVVLSGGVFQNLILLANIKDGLVKIGLEPVVHRRVPSNDGGLSLGQVFWAARQRPH